MIKSYLDTALARLGNSGNHIGAVPQPAARWFAFERSGQLGQLLGIGQLPPRLVIADS